MDARKDLALVLFLLVLKLTILPTLGWWMVVLPLVIGFIYNFIKGFLNGLIEGHEDRKKQQ